MHKFFLLCSPHSDEYHRYSHTASITHKLPFLFPFLTCVLLSELAEMGDLRVTQLCKEPLCLCWEFFAHPISLPVSMCISSVKKSVGSKKAFVLGENTG